MGFSTYSRQVHRMNRFACRAEQGRSSFSLLIGAAIRDRHPPAGARSVR
jgi:hypothetical protein